jgi:hypothetical protein
MGAYRQPHPAWPRCGLLVDSFSQISRSRPPAIIIVRGLRSRLVRAHPGFARQMVLSQLGELRVAHWPPARAVPGGVATGRCLER